MAGDLFISDYLKNQVFIAFDTETTGMWAASHKIVEISAVKFSLNQQETEIFDFLVNPKRKIPADVIEIHGITDDMVETAPDIKTVLSKFIEFCGDDSILIAHNAPFDISFVGCELSRSDLSFGNNPIMDTVNIFKYLYPDLASYSLMNLCKKFKVKQENRHRALSDAYNVYHLFLEALKKFPDVKNQTGLKEYFKIHYMTEAINKTTEIPSEYKDIKEAIDKKFRLEIEYQHPKRGADKRIIIPREIHQLGSSFYIIGYCELVKEDRTFRLDRINNYKIIKS